jgi:hypothetical protein
VAVFLALAGSLALLFSTFALGNFLSQDAEALSGSGTGVEGDPFIITTCDQLVEIETDGEAWYELAADINTDSCTTTFEPISGFMGVLDGAGHEITMNVTAGGTQVGLFVTIGYGSVSDLSLTGQLTATSGSVQIGSLAGGGIQADIFRVASNVNISASDSSIVGGLIGAATQTTIEDSYYVGEIVADTEVGGLLGWTSTDTIINRSYSAAVLTGNVRVGGLAGQLTGSTTINDSFSMSHISAMGPGNFAKAGMVGGIFEESTVTFSNSFYDASIIPEGLGCTSTVNSTTADTHTGCTAINGEVLPDYFKNNTSADVFSTWTFPGVWTQTAVFPSLTSLTHNYEAPVVVEFEGTGTEEDPYLISTCPELLAISQDMSANYELEGDVECFEGLPITDVGDNFFSGVLDGAGNTITYEIPDATGSIGLFTGVDMGVIKNLTLLTHIASEEEIGEIGAIAPYAQGSLIQNVDAEIYIEVDAVQVDTGLTYIGGLFAEVDGSEFSSLDIHTEITLSLTGETATIKYIGGVAGYTNESIFEDIQVDGAISTYAGGETFSETYGIGGVVGNDVSDTIFTDVHSGMDITALTEPTDSYVQTVGGIAGILCEDSGFCDVDDSTWNGEILIQSLSVSNVGGIAGSTELSYEIFKVQLVNNHTLGSINITYFEHVDDIGGLFGDLEDGSVLFNSSLVTITLTTPMGDRAQSIGGLIGEAGDDDISDSFYNGTISVTLDSAPEEDYPAEVGGLTGYLDDSSIERSYAVGQLEYGDADSETVHSDIGGLVGALFDSEISDSFSAVEVSVSGAAENIGELLGYADEEMTLDNNKVDTYIASLGTCVGNTETTTDQCEAVNSGNEQPDYFKNNSTNSPLNRWDFEVAWATAADSYPLIRENPVFVPEPYEDGEGTEEDPYLISTCQQLQDIGGFPDSYFVLDTDIECEGFNFKPIGYTEGSVFSGTLDGQGNTIRNVTIDTDGGDFVGLFTAIFGGLVVDLNLENYHYTGGYGAGGIAGVLDDEGAIVGVSAQGLLEQCYYGCGGLVGHVNAFGEGSSFIVASTTDVHINTGDWSVVGVGGLAGISRYAYIEDSSAVADIQIQSQEVYGVGGLVGRSYGEDPEDNWMASSYSHSDIAVSPLPLETPEEASLNDIGGLIGQLQGGIVADSYSRGTIFTDNGGGETASIGGLIGSSMSGVVATSYSAGAIELRGGENIEIGGLIGALALPNWIYDSFSATGALAIFHEYVNLTGGIVGLIYDSEEEFAEIDGAYYDGYVGPNLCLGGGFTVPILCEGVNIANSTPDYFKGNSTNAPFGLWDFDDIWTVVDGDYPQLRNEEEPDDEEEEETGGEESTDEEENEQEDTQGTTTTVDQSEVDEDTEEIILNLFDEYLSDGKILELEVGDVVYFNIINENGETEEHSVTIKEINEDSIVITIASEPVEREINLGGSITQDVDQNGADDIEITFMSVDENTATVRFRGLEADGSAQSPENEESEETSNQEDDPEKSSNWWRVVATVMVAGAVYYFKKRVESTNFSK